MSSLSATFLPAEPDNARPETEPRSKDSSRSDRDRVGYLPSLDGWRAIAISAVLLDHSAVLPWRFARHHLQNKGADGVWLFFAISGLLICSRLLNEEKRNGKISLPNFYIRRSFRIFPASFTFLAILLGLEALKIIPLNHSAWLSALLFCRNYWSYFMQSGDSGTWFTSHFWSLAVEEHFYLFFPTLLVLFPRARHAVIATLAAFFLGWSVFYMATHPPATRNIFWNQRTEFCLFGLLVPALCALILDRGETRKYATKYLHVVPLLLLSAIVLFLQDRFNHNGIPSLAEAIIFPLLLLSTSLHPENWLTRMLETAPFRFIGRISYSLYLWQILFLTRSITYPGRIHTLQSPITEIGCAVLCALASFYFIETPMIAFGKRFVRGGRQSALSLSTLPLPSDH
ncbi:MAG: acyltransferase [Acidobacteriaceae bacterium]|nr:acyltransferase [Acidobacteriaceae bacterium]